RLKSEEMLAAIAQAFEQAGDRLPDAERRRIEEKAAAVRAALESHETPRLKAANVALDDATQELAALIIEQAMAVSPQRG
ncbi:MAG: molecular chaperone DnaK, partial [Chthoniobacterales bacterium]